MNKMKNNFYIFLRENALINTQLWPWMCSNNKLPNILSETVYLHNQQMSTSFLPNIQLQIQWWQLFGVTGVFFMILSNIPDV